MPKLVFFYGTLMTPFNRTGRLRIELGERSVVVKGRVVHSQIADVDDDVLVYSTGIEFVEPSEHVSNAIAGFLKSVRAERF